MIDNKWTHGKVKLILPPIPPVLLERSGVKPVPLIFDQNIGTEIALLITEPREKAREFGGRDITGFFLKSGLVKTSYGPICWLLFFFPSPVTGQKVTYENVLNPKDEQQISIYRQLGKQKYWHVVIVDDQCDVVNFFEFRNNFRLLDALKQMQQVCYQLDVVHFGSAKAEYEATYSIEELLNT